MIHWHLVAKMRNNLSFNKRFQFAQLFCTILIKFQRKKTCGQAADRGVPKTTGTIEDTKWPLAVWRANRAHFAINLLRRRRRDTVNFNIYIIESRARPRWLLKFMFLVVLMHCHNAPRTHTISPPDGVRLLTQSALASVANYGQMIGRCPFFPGGRSGGGKCSAFQICDCWTNCVCERCGVSLSEQLAPLLPSPLESFIFFFALSLLEREKDTPICECVCGARLFCLATWPICGGGANVVCAWIVRVPNSYAGGAEFS